jgi:sulfide:quinone oxidoreductase
MHYPKLSSILTVAPQIRPEDLDAIAAAGYKTVINNRPDGEAMDQPTAAAMAELIEQAQKPVFAYCRTGTRCTVLWALSEAGKLAPETIVNRAAEAGYDLNGLLPRLISRWQDQHG